MDLSFLKKSGSRAVVALLGLTACMGIMQAATLTATPSTVSISCSGGTATANVVIKPVTALTGSSTIVVSTATLPASISVTAPSNQTLSTSTQTAGLTYVVGLGAGVNSCAGLPSSTTFNFKAGATTDVLVTVNFVNSGNVLSPSANSVNVVCDPLGTSNVTQTVVIRPVMTLASNTIAVAFTGASSPLQVTPTSGTLNSSNQSAGLTFTVGFVNGGGCNLPATQTLTFTANGTNDVHVTVNIATLGVSVSPATLTLSCTKTGASTWVPAAAQTITVTGSGGNFPFTVSAPSWVTLSATSGTANSSGATFTARAANGCNSLAGGASSSGQISITVTGQASLNKTIATTLSVVTPTTLTAAPAAPSLTYVKGSGNPGKVAVTITTSTVVTPAPYFSIKNLPAWLTVDSIGGNTPKTVNFSSTTIADTLAPGTYTANIVFSVSGYTDYPLSISLLITNKAPTLSISGGSSVSKQWIQGTALPTVTLTALSTDTPIPFTVTTGGPLAPVVAQNSGLAYNFGTSIPVTFTPSVFSAAQPGATLTGTVSIAWGQPVSTTVVAINVTVLSANATLTAVTPTGLPTASAGATFNISFTGAGFVPGTDPTVRTKLGIVPSGGSTLVFDQYILPTVSANSITAIITVPPASVNDTNLPFGTGGTVTFGVCNPIPPAGTCSTPTGQTVTMTISSNPIIQAVTSSSSFIQATPPSNPSVAPYDMISIFGANFCPTCSSNTVIFGSPDSSMRYPTSVNPLGDTTDSINVSFYPHGQTPTSGNLIAAAPILFATNTQINAIVPSGVAGQSSGVDAYVSWGPSATPNVSAAFMLNVVTADPGIFTIGQDGQGSGAILDGNYKVVASTNPAGLRKTQANSDTVALYMTGLGVPDSTADNASTGTSTWPTDCVAASTGSGITTFLQSLEAAYGLSNITLDGAVIQSSLLNTGRYQPCFGSGDITVTIGGVNAPVKFAGWVASTVAGLYQVNVQMPSSTASLVDVNGNSISSFNAPMQLPVVVTVGSGGSAPVSQNGVTIWSAPRLLVSAPSQPYSSATNQFVGTVGQVWGMVNGSNTCSPASLCKVVASDSTGSSPSYTYAISSGALPVGLSFNTATGAITGTPAANSAGTYNVTVTATDTSVTPVLTGSSTMQIVIAGGLYMTANPATSTINGTSGTAVSNVVTVTPSGGAAPYTYALASTASGTPALPTSVAVNTSGRVSMTAQMPAGTYPVAVTATDSNGLTGSYGFNLNVALNMTNTTVNNTIVGTNAGTIATVTTTGQTGTITYSVTAVDSLGNAINWVAIDPSSGVLTVTSSSATGNGYVATVTATDSVAASGSSAAATTTLPITFNIQ